jgi:multiple sugar transport system substrate-binding protein
MSDKRFQRRKFLKAGSTAAVFALAGCSGGGGDGGDGSGGDGGGDDTSPTPGGGDTPTATPPGTDVETADTIQFISEATAPSRALKSIKSSFEEDTGITVEFTLTPLLNYTEKLANDLTSQSGTFDACYVDPYNIGAPYYPDLEPLDAYIEANDYDLQDHEETHITACSIYEQDGTVRALPYDAPTIIMAYRKDVFDEHGQQAESDLGFEPEPNPDMTWSQYMEVARWINENVPDDMVPYGTGHMAKQHQALANEFEMFQWAWGGSQLEGFDGKDPSVPADTSPTFTTEESVAAAEFYRELVGEVAHPDSTAWNWTGVAQGFANGKLAMHPSWHEFSAFYADPESSQVADTVRWTLAPSGPAEDRNVQSHYGGSGIGINAHTTDAKKKAAWRFIEWTTSTETQFELIKAAGGTPTRASVYERSEVQEAMQSPPGESAMPNVSPPIREMWKPDVMGQRPHHPDWLQLEKVVYTEGSKMVAGDKSAQATMESINNGFDSIL